MNTLIPVFPKLDEPLRKQIADAFAAQIARCVLESMSQGQLPTAGEAGGVPHESPSPNMEHK